MDPTSAISASKIIADAGFLPFVILIVIGLVMMLRSQIAKTDAVQAKLDASQLARIDDTKEYAGTLARSNDLMRELGEVVRDAKEAALYERMLRMRLQEPQDKPT